MSPNAAQRRSRLWPWCAALLLCACAPGLVLPLAPPPAPPAGEPLMRVVCQGQTGPLRVRGTGVAYAEVGRALCAEIDRAARPFADRHRAERPGGWELQVEITQADAARRAGQVTVALSIRATLRARTGRVYLAQNHQYCSEARAVAPEGAAPVFLACLDTLGRDLGDWLGGVSP